MDMEIAEPPLEPPKPLLELKFLFQSACSFTIEFEENRTNSVSKEQSLVVKDIEKLIENDPGIPRRILKGLEMIIMFPNYLQKALLPTALKKEGVSFVMEQESLIRLLLRVNKLQEAVFEQLKHELYRVCSDTEDCYLLRLLLNPLKYLPNINNADQFSSDVLDCLELSTIPMQLEILDSLPDIIPDSCYDCVARKLVKLLGTDECPSEAVIECFGAFDFTDEVKKSMFTSLMDKILPRQSVCLPPSLKLLFETQKGKIPIEILLKLRDMIDKVMSETDNDQIKDSIVGVIQSFSHQENIAQSCIDLVNSIETPDENKPFDLFVLLILGDDTKYKELIRKKIESKHFTLELLNNLLLNIHYLKALASSNQSMKCLVKLAGYLMKFHSAKVEKFAGGLLGAMTRFSLEKDKFLIDTKEILTCLLNCCNNSDMKCVNQTLRIFWNLVEAHPKRFYENLNKLMWLLKKIEDFDLVAAKMAYTILCHIPYDIDPDHPYSEVMRDEISMVVRKQLMSSKRLKKSIGIMGAIVQIQGCVADKNQEVHNQLQVTEIGDPPPASIQEAVTIIESVTVLSEAIPECLGLFYDELTVMAGKRPMKMDFRMWMLRQTRILLDRYFIDPKLATAEINGLEYAPRYSYSNDRSVVSLNVGLMTVEPHKYEGSPIMLLAPLFRLFRVLVLEIVDKSTKLSEKFSSYIRCSFVLPDIDDLEDLNHDQLKQAAEILFHTINYLKEVISGITKATTNKENIPIDFLQKLLKERLELLVKLESAFNDCLSSISEHSLPQVYFQDCYKTKQVYESKKKPPKKKVKLSKALLDDSIASTSSVLTTREPQTPASTSQVFQKGLKGKSKPSKENNINFREIDLFSLLKIIELSDGETTLDHQSLAFVLKDLVKSLTITLQVNPEDNYEAIYKNLNPVIKSFYDLTKTLEALDVQKLQDETHIDEINCYTHFLEIFNTILSATVNTRAFIDDIHEALNPGFDKSEKRKKNRWILAEVLTPYLKYCIVLSQGVLLFKIVNTILGTEQNKQRVELILKLGDDIVYKHWTMPKIVPYSEKQCIQDTTYVLEKYFQELKVSYLHDLLAKVALEYAELKLKNDYLPSLSIINYSNFHVLFVTLCTALRVNVEKEVDFMVKISKQIEKRGTRESVQEVRILKMDQLKLWKNTTNMMFHLMEMARNVKNRQNTLLSAFLKKSIPILKMFKEFGLPLFDEMFPSKMEMVVDILKSMQTSTRFIHQLCCQSKMFKNLAVVSHIPSFRLVLEQLIYSVKALLVSHKCEDAFFLGNLKNKDIHGNTQTSEVMEEDSQENEEDDDEEMLGSDEEPDVTMEDDRSESLTF